MEPSEKEKILYGCTRFLSGHGFIPPQVELERLSQEAAQDSRADRYGTGELIEAFEKEAADLLGKDAAVFMVSGTMAQQCALRVWSERRSIRGIAFHPLCHLEIHEDKAYQHLHGLKGVVLGSPHRLITLQDLEAIREPLAALLLELPQREIGGQLPAWDELVSQAGWARRQGIPLHMDGARLWECGPFYQRPYAEIAALFDSVYVSFYKALGGISGAALAGPTDFIKEARLWQHRHGGVLDQQYPLVLAARAGLRERLPRMAQYHQKALEVAEILTSFEPRAEVVPDPPATNMMHVYLRGEKEGLEQASLRIAETHKVCLMRTLFPSPIPGLQRIEISIGDSALQIGREELHSLFAELLGG
jgi:threonine aldolase